MLRNCYFFNWFQHIVMCLSKFFANDFSGREVIQGMEFIRVSQKFPQISNDPHFVSGL